MYDYSQAGDSKISPKRHPMTQRAHKPNLPVVYSRNNSAARIEAAGSWSKIAENAAAASSMIVAGEALVSLSLEKQEASAEFQRFSTVGNEKAHQS